jgi:alpha-tubulin suppressor-like RCC1 family protein
VSRAWLVCVALGCVGPAPYRCVSSGECELDGEPGRCEPLDLAREVGTDNPGVCHFPDEVCPSGRRYGDDQGKPSGACLPCGGPLEVCCQGESACGAGLACTDERCTCVVGVAPSERHTCAVKADGAVFCWGLNDWGQLGDDSLVGSPVPRRVDVPPAIGVASARDHSCALDADGGVWCWGANTAYQLGDGTTEKRTGPARALLSTPARAISAALAHTCALMDDGGVECWGHFIFNQDWQIPTRVPGIEMLPVQLSAGSSVDTVRMEDGSVWSWGASYSGESGSGQSGLFLEPIRTSLDLPARDVANGGARGCAVATDGSAWCWGVGDTGLTRSFVPEPMSTPGPVRRVAVGARRCGLLEDGSVWCWGADAGPVPLPLPAHDLVMSARTSCIATRSGLFCWGDNDHGQLGDGTLIDRDFPTAALLSCP